MMDFQSPSPLPTCLKKPLNRKSQNGQLRGHSVTLEIFHYQLKPLRSTSFWRIEYNLSLNPVVYSFFGSILLPWKLHWEHFVYFSLKLLVIANRTRTLFDNTRRCRLLCWRWYKTCPSPWHLDQATHMLLCTVNESVNILPRHKILM